MANPFYTIGHSTRSIPEFAPLLQAAEVRLVVDVRTVPRSRANPQFNREALPDSLAGYGIGYEHMAALGGLRGKQGGLEASPNTFWDNASFRHYADYAMTEPFRSALAGLRALGQERCCAIMCAEAVWWRCHRRIIADYLVSLGDPVLHILGPDHVAPATMTPAARPTPSGALVYPACRKT